MKKILSVVFVLLSILFINVNFSYAQEVDRCASGDLFGNITGQPCPVIDPNNGGSGGGINPGVSGGSCVDLTQGMVIGSTDESTGGEVSKLQQFLIDQGIIYAKKTKNDFFVDLGNIFCKLVKINIIKSTKKNFSEI